jgi:hypothetical protein
MGYSGKVKNLVVLGGAMVKGRALILFAVITVLGGVAIADEDAVTPLRPTDEAMKAVSQIKQASYSSRLQRIQTRLSIGQGGDSISLTNDYEPLGQALWGIRSVSKQNKTAVEANSVSVCGLIELVGTSHSNIDYDMAISTPVGRTFTSFTINGHMVGASTSQANSIVLVSGEEYLCNPVAGSTFEYTVETRHSLFLKGMFSHQRESTNAFQWKCSVGDARPMSDLLAEQVGTYLPVSCTGGNQALNAKTLVEFAFLQPFGIYLELSRTGSSFSSKTAISSFAYE